MVHIFLFDEADMHVTSQGVVQTCYKIPIKS